MKTPAILQFRAPPHRREAIEELADLADNSTAPLLKAMERVGRLRLRQFYGRHENPRDTELALNGLSTQIAQTMALADLYGRRRTVLEYQSMKDRQPKDLPRMLFAATPVVPGVPFDEAAEDLVNRTPMLADPLSPVPRWRQIADLYQTKHAFGAARVWDLKVTEKIHDQLIRDVEMGIPRRDTEELLTILHDWSRSYAELVYRTNLNTAFTAGRLVQAKDPDIEFVIPALQFSATQDVAVRPHHLAAHGLVASQHDPIWNVFAPPLGYQCRCAIRFVDRYELKRRGLLRGAEILMYKPANFSAAHPDPGFERKSRPDTLIYS